MMAELQQVQRNRMITVIPQIAFFAFMAVTCTACLIMPVSADDIFDIAKSAMQNVYKDVAGIATVAAVVCSAVFDELFKIRKDRGRIACMVETYCGLLGSVNDAWSYRNLHGEDHTKE